MSKAEPPTDKVYEWQQAISWELGCPWGEKVYTLEECVEKIRGLRESRT